MLYIAKMATKYPDFHGSGYYNFLMEDDQGTLEAKIEEYSHDFGLVSVQELPFSSVEALLAKYPTKKELNDKYWG